MSDKKSNGGDGDRVTIGDARPTLAPSLGGAPAAPVGGAPAPPRLPLFYQRIEPLNKERHADLGLRDDGGYRFAAVANAVPLNAVEFPVILKNYPIVFTGEAEPVPVVVLGLQPGQNLYVESDGAWSDGAYIPAYIRRYPFLFSTTPDQQKVTLCIDAGSPMVERGGARRIFEDGEPSDLTKRAIEFCQSFHGHFELTRAFCTAIAEHELLDARSVEVKLPSGRQITLRGFRTIDEAKFKALPDAVFLDWRNRNWLHLVYCHLISLTNWSVLVNRAVQRGMVPGAAPGTAPDTMADGA